MLCIAPHAGILEPLPLSLGMDVCMQEQCTARSSHLHAAYTACTSHHIARTGWGIVLYMSMYLMHSIFTSMYIVYFMYFITPQCTRRPGHRLVHVHVLHVLHVTNACATRAMVLHTGILQPLPLQPEMDVCMQGDKAECVWILQVCCARWHAALQPAVGVSTVPRGTSCCGCECCARWHGVLWL